MTHSGKWDPGRKGLNDSMRETGLQPDYSQGRGKKTHRAVNIKFNSIQAQKTHRGKDSIRGRNSVRVKGPDDSRWNALTRGKCDSKWDSQCDSKGVRSLWRLWVGDLGEWKGAPRLVLEICFMGLWFCCSPRVVLWVCVSSGTCWRTQLLRRFESRCNPPPHHPSPVRIRSPISFVATDYHLRKLCFNNSCCVICRVLTYFLSVTIGGVTV
jgi:hypothetical protein